MTDAARADYNCPECGTSDVFRDGKKVYVCRACGMKVHEGVLQYGDSLQNLAERDDMVGAFATRLLETGGVAE